MKRLLLSGDMLTITNSYFEEIERIRVDLSNSILKYTTEKSSEILSPFGRVEGNIKYYLVDSHIGKYLVGTTYHTIR